MEKNLAFIGTGIMGHPMVENLLRAHYPVTVYTRTSAKASDLVSQGARLAESIEDAVTGADIIITMLPDTPDVREVYFGAGGVLQFVRPGALLIDMSTVSPMFAKELAKAAREVGCEALDAPVSGGETGAKQGMLSIMVGGSLEAFQKAQSVLKVLGARILHMGEAGAGQVTKACNQIAVAINIVGVSEAFRFAEANGVDVHLVQEGLMGGFAQSRVLEIHGTRIINRAFQPGFRLRLHRKDLDIALEQGTVALPATTLIRDMMDSRIDQGMGDWDHSALFIEDVGRGTQG